MPAMNESRDAVQADWQGRPLCSRYLLVRLNEVHLQVHQATQHALLYWATGVASNGQQEVLGVWVLGSSGSPDWRHVFDDLAVRGVEQIDVLTSDESSVRHASPSDVTELLPVIRQLGTNREPGQYSSPRLRRTQDAAMLPAKSMQAELIQLVVKHGSFDSLAAAVDFLANALQRMDRKFWTAQPTRVRSTPRRRPVVASRLATASLARSQPSESP